MEYEGRDGLQEFGNAVAGWLSVRIDAADNGQPGIAELIQIAIGTWFYEETGGSGHEGTEAALRRLDRRLLTLGDSAPLALLEGNDPFGLLLVTGIGQAVGAQSQPLREFAQSLVAALVTHADTDTVGELAGLSLLASWLGLSPPPPAPPRLDLPTSDVQLLRLPDTQVAAVAQIVVADTAFGTERPRLEARQLSRLSAAVPTWAHDFLRGARTELAAAVLRSGAYMSPHAARDLGTHLQVLLSEQLLARHLREPAAAQLTPDENHRATRASVNCLWTAIEVANPDVRLMGMLRNALAYPLRRGAAHALATPA